MFRKSNLALLIALAVGVAAGWAGASGKFDALLRAEPKPTVSTETPAPTCPESGCCASPNKAAVLTEIDAHNQQVAAKFQKDGKKPNIVVIMGDDIGVWNIGAYHRGMMSGKTPNLDKLASQGMMFTDYYAEASCTAGRASFITGEIPLRTGLTTVGQAGADVGMPAQA